MSKDLWKIWFQDRADIFIEDLTRYSIKPKSTINMDGDGKYNVSYTKTNYNDFMNQIVILQILND